jgi:hypothetical protein
MLLVGIVADDRDRRTFGQVPAGQRELALLPGRKRMQADEERAPCDEPPFLIG